MVHACASGRGETSMCAQETCSDLDCLVVDFQNDRSTESGCQSLTMTAWWLARTSASLIVTCVGVGVHFSRSGQPFCERQLRQNDHHCQDWPLTCRLGKVMHPLAAPHPCWRVEGQVEVGGVGVPLRQSAYLQQLCTTTPDPVFDTHIHAC